MNDKLLHTPDGVRDIYGIECKKKLKIVDKIHHVLALFSYQDIETPSFEYFDIFNMDKGSAPSNEMYKFFDRNNNTLVLRPDLTPSVARCVAKYYANEELPIRLCYQGNTFTNAPLHQGKLNECTQIGGELVNDDSSAADAEAIACVISCLKASGLSEFQIEIGEIEYFKGLIEEAGLDIDMENKIRDYIHIKNFFGLSEFVETLDISSGMKRAFTSFETLFGGLDMLERARGLVSNSTSLLAIDRMEKVYHALTNYGYEKYVDFDLGMLNRYNYYTGIVFRGYTYGTGDAIVKGGRYNNLLSQFGKDAASVGFAIYVDELMMAVSRNKVEVEVDYSNILVLYDIEYQANAIKLTTSLRNKGKKIELIRKSSKHTVEDYVEYAKKMHLSGVYHFTSQLDINVISVIDDAKETIKLGDIM
ncbi:MAG: ATP phosphoribosyltransferase regulatory subunit [Clostridium sp.]|nr:ATP phosphoribosyltransferase regulatory subunit [Clostridium sp.]MCM1458504.1 ATP phosphoribosyltransferase regulatory subunit [Bacteroides sp.]